MPSRAKCPWSEMGSHKEGLSRRLNRVPQGLATQEVAKGLKVLCEVRGTEDLASLGIFFWYALGYPRRCEHFLY